MIFAILYSDGELKSKDIYNECKTQKWVPLMFYKPIESDKKRLICFKHGDIAGKFINRNIPKKWLRGAVSLVEEDLQWIEEQGWEIEFMEFPRKLFNNPKVEVSFEVLEFRGEPDVNCLS